MQKSVVLQKEEIAKPFFMILLRKSPHFFPLYVYCNSITFCKTAISKSKVEVFVFHRLKMAVGQTSWASFKSNMEVFDIQTY
jgi:hypothetical protein